MLSRTAKNLLGMTVIVVALLAGALALQTSVASAHVKRPPVLSAPKVSRPSNSGVIAAPGVVAAPAVIAASGIVPPANPAESLPPSPNFTGNGSCGYGALNDSQGCNTTVVQAINTARASLESLAPLSLNISAFDAMTVPQQLFVITNLERTNRGLAPIAGLTTQLDNVAQTGAADNADPTLSASSLTGGAYVTSWGSLWAGGTSNPLGSDYYWMYDDGYHSPNASCTTSTPLSCWGHRDQILGTFSSSTSCFGSDSEQYMGAGYVASSPSFGPSFTEILVGACGPPPTDVVFTWTQAQQLLGTLAGSSISAVSPSTGPTAGGTSVTITGINFTGVTSVSFGSTPAASFTVNSPISISAISPAHPAGTVDTTVTGPSGPSAVVAADQFTFVSPALPDFSLALSPASQSVAAGGSAAYVVSLEALNDDTSPVTLSVSGAPAGTTFSPDNPAWSAGGATSTMTVPGSAAVGSYTMTVTGLDAAGRTHSVPATLTVTGGQSGGTANIFGTVSSAGVPVSGATVTVLLNGTVVDATTTNSAGSYTVIGLAQATFSLVVTAPGYISDTVSIRVFSDNWSEVNIALSQ
jgi:Carboxypeptidase regulatory-like domain/IPT/TIG domain